MQVVAGGTLSGEVITVTSDGKISGNSDNAALFGLATTKMRFASTEFTASAGLSNLNLTIDGTASCYCDGFSRCNDTISSLANWSVDCFNVTGSANGRVVIEYDPAVNSVVFDQPQNALGMKTADLQLKLEDDHISVTSLERVMWLDVTATANSLASQKYL